VSSIEEAHEGRRHPRWSKTAGPTLRLRRAPRLRSTRPRFRARESATLRGRPAVAAPPRAALPRRERTRRTPQPLFPTTVPPLGLPARREAGDAKRAACLAPPGRRKRAP